MKTRTWVARPVACSVAFATAVALAGSVLAQERQGVSVRTMTVHYGDLDISNTAGATTLYHRILGAARTVCGEEGYEIGVDARRFWNTCFHGAVNDAVAKVHSPLLNAVHLKSTPESPATAMLGH
jgi:UrcA family protein